MYGCDTGFDLSGDSQRRCEYNQQWSGSQPTCEPVNCGDPETLENGYHDGGAYYTFGAHVTYNCIAGYVLHGSQTLTCTDNGVWSDPVPTCDPIDCGDPGMADNTQRTGSTFTYLSVITYTCKPGFHAVHGMSTIQCLNTGQWTSTNLLECAPADHEEGMCGDPGTVDNAERTGDMFAAGSVVVYTCTAGYQLSGSSALLCTIENSWNDTLPTCEKLTSHSKMLPPKGSTGKCKSASSMHIEIVV